MHCLCHNNNCREAAVLLLLCIIGAIHQLDNASSIVQSISGTSGCQWMSQAPKGWVNCRSNCSGLRTTHHAKNRQWVPSTTGKRRPLQNKQVLLGGISPVLGVISQRTSNNCQGELIGRGTVVRSAASEGALEVGTRIQGTGSVVYRCSSVKGGKAILLCSVVMAYVMEIVVVNLFWPLKSGRRYYESIVGQLAEINPHYWMGMTRHWMEM